MIVVFLPCIVTLDQKNRIIHYDLKPANVLEAMCTTILKSVAYADRRVRVAVCNILLQRVQVNIKVDKIALRTLNARLFPPPESHAD